MPTKPKPRRVSLGPALPRSKKVLEGLSLISLTDIEQARALQREHAPTPYETLLDAMTEVEDG